MTQGSDSIRSCFKFCYNVVIHVAAAAPGSGTMHGALYWCRLWAMCGPCRRRVSGDAAVARVVVCTDARPLVHILVRGGVVPWLWLWQCCRRCPHCNSLGGRVAVHGCFMVLALPPRGLVWLKCRVAITGCNSLVRMMAHREII